MTEVTDALLDEVIAGRKPEIDRDGSFVEGVHSAANRLEQALALEVRRRRERETELLRELSLADSELEQHR